MPRYHGRRIDDLFWFGLTVGITIDCILAIGLCSWTAFTGTVEEQVVAFYSSLMPWIIGSITFITAELLRPRKP